MQVYLLSHSESLWILMKLSMLPLARFSQLRSRRLCWFVSRHDLRDELFPLLQLSHSASITAVEELSSEDAAEFEERITTRKAMKAASNVPAAPNSSEVHCSRLSIHPHKKIDL